MIDDKVKYIAINHIKLMTEYTIKENERLNRILELMDKNFKGEEYGKERKGYDSRYNNHTK